MQPFFKILKTIFKNSKLKIEKKKAFMIIKYSQSSGRGQGNTLFHSDLLQQVCNSGNKRDDGSHYVRERKQRVKTERNKGVVQIGHKLKLKHTYVSKTPHCSIYIAIYLTLSTKKILINISQLTSLSTPTKGRLKKFEGALLILEVGLTNIIIKKSEPS